MEDKISIVVTSIASPNKALRELARGCVEKGYHFIVIGDEASPAEFHIDGCDFYDLKRQKQTGCEQNSGNANPLQLANLATKKSRCHLLTQARNLMGPVGFEPTTNGL